MNTRLFTSEDAPALARIHIDSWREAYKGLVPPEYLKGLSYERRADAFRQAAVEKTEETYCAEDQGQIIGFVTVGLCRDADVDRAKTGEIWGIYLDPEHWRKGIGRTLCRHAETALASRRCEQVVLWVFEENGQARRFYEAMGFRVDGNTENLMIGGKSLVALRYRKTLDKN